jgi:hypothetical protein
MNLQRFIRFPIQHETEEQYLNMLKIENSTIANRLKPIDNANTRKPNAVNYFR